MIKLKGTSIIEIIIATALISVAMIAALSLMNRSQSQNNYARNLDEANSYITQAADWIRSQRDSLGYATIYTLSGPSTNTYCLNTFPATITSITLGACTDYLANIFQRNITITRKGTTSLLIGITVSWMEKTSRQATIEMELSQW